MSETIEIDENIVEQIELSSHNSISNVDSSKKQRVRRYFKKKDEIELKCEWKNCEKLYKNMDIYLSHIDQHLNDYLSGFFDHNGEDFECFWQGCDAQSFDRCESTFKRHVRFHAFHTKLKQIGKNVLSSLEDNFKEKNLSVGQLNAIHNVPRCNLDDQTRNIIPELPYRFQCSWNSCQFYIDNPELFYRHIKTHVDEYPKELKNDKCLWSECKQQISNKNRLIEHIRHHSQEKLVACPTCGSLFATITKFIDHCSRSSDSSSKCFFV
jgi:hypothetical protein